MVIVILVHVEGYVEEGTCTAAFFYSVFNEVIIQLRLVSSVGCFQIGVSLGIILGVKHIGAELCRDLYVGSGSVSREIQD